MIYSRWQKSIVYVQIYTTLTWDHISDGLAEYHCGLHVSKLKLQKCRAYILPRTATKVRTKLEVRTEQNLENTNTPGEGKK